MGLFAGVLAELVDVIAPFDLANAVIRYFVYDGSNVLLDLVDSDGAGAALPVVSKRYLHGPGVDMVLAQENVDKPLGDVDRTWWLLPDQMGSTRDVVNSNGKVVAHFQFDSFGQILDGRENVTRYQFTGREHDSHTDYNYHRARWYDPTTGRWLSEDPIRLGGGDVNLSRYVGNGPTNGVDLNGLEEMPPNSGFEEGNDGHTLFSFPLFRYPANYMTGRSAQMRKAATLEAKRLRMNAEREAGPEGVLTAGDIGTLVGNQNQKDALCDVKGEAGNLFEQVIVEGGVEVVTAGAGGLLSHGDDVLEGIEKAGGVAKKSDRSADVVVNLAKAGIRRGELEFGGFAKGISADEIASINRMFGGSLLQGSPSSALAAAARQDGFYNKSAALIRSIVKNHTFTDGNKRTAQRVFETLKTRNNVTTGVSCTETRRIIQQIAEGKLDDVGEIARRLRGF